MKPLFLLDSSVCIPVLRNQVDLRGLPDPMRTGIPVMVAAELWTGVRKSPRSQAGHGARLEGFLGLFQLVEFTLDAAMHYADIRATLEIAGTPIGPMDLLIAAQAWSLEATLVTAKAVEFRRVKGLKVRVFRAKTD